MWVFLGKAARVVRSHPDQTTLFVERGSHWLCGWEPAKAGDVDARSDANVEAQLEVGGQELAQLCQGSLHHGGLMGTQDVLMRL